MAVEVYINKHMQECFTVLLGVIFPIMLCRKHVNV